MKIDENGKVIYSCDNCGSSGLKLWRDYNAFLSHQTLTCVPCLMKSFDPSKDRSELDEYRVLDDSGNFTFSGGTEINGKIPAVLTEDGTTFYGFTSGSDTAYRTWYSLPTYLHRIDLENVCNRNLMLKFFDGRSYAQKRSAELDEKISRFQWEYETGIYASKVAGVFNVWTVTNRQIFDKDGVTSLGWCRSGDWVETELPAETIFVWFGGHARIFLSNRLPGTGGLRYASGDYSERREVDMDPEDLRNFQMIRPPTGNRTFY